MAIKSKNLDAEILRLAEEDGLTSSHLPQKIEVIRYEVYETAARNYYRGWQDGQDSTIRETLDSPLRFGRLVIVYSSTGAAILLLTYLTLILIHWWRI